MPWPHERTDRRTITSDDRKPEQKRGSPCLVLGIPSPGEKVLVLGYSNMTWWPILNEKVSVVNIQALRVLYVRTCCVCLTRPVCREWFILMTLHLNGLIIGTVFCWIVHWLRCWCVMVLARQRVTWNGIRSNAMEITDTFRRGQIWF